MYKPINIQLDIVRNVKLGYQVGDNSITTNICNNVPVIADESVGFINLLRMNK